MLFVSHHLYLTREERYAVDRGEEVEVIGSSVPVWYFKEKTSEPANEIFAKYKIIIGENKKVEINQDRTWTLEIPKKIKNEKFEPERVLTSKDLLDIKDGGVGEINFKILSKIQRKTRFINVFHTVNVSDINKLTESLEY